RRSRTSFARVRASSGARERDRCDLAARPDAHRWSPEPGALADVEPCRPESRESSDARLEQAHEPTEWQQLAAVRVTRELEIDAGRDGVRDRSRMMGEQHERQRRIAPR